MVPRLSKPQKDSVLFVLALQIKLKEFREIFGKIYDVIHEHLILENTKVQESTLLR